MNTLKLLLLIFTISLISSGCGIGNIKNRQTETKETEYDDGTSRTDDNTYAVPVYRVQIGVFDNQGDAEKLADLARSKTEHTVYLEYRAPFFRVQVGDFSRKSDAENYVIVLKQEGFSDSRYVYKVEY